MVEYRILIGGYFSEERISYSLIVKNLLTLLETKVIKTRANAVRTRQKVNQLLPRFYEQTIAER